MSIQKSKYIAIDNDLRNIQKFANLDKVELDLVNKKIANTYAKLSIEDKLYLRFCNTLEVQKKRKKYFMYKGKYLGNITSLR